MPISFVFNNKPAQVKNLGGFALFAVVNSNVLLYACAFPNTTFNWISC